MWGAVRRHVEGLLLRQHVYISRLRLVFVLK
jgi:hypothetical protein